MKIDELKKKLIEENIYPGAYSLFGDGLGNCHVLTKEGHKWLVYYSERGERYSVRYFQDEDDACQYLLDKILSSSDARYKIFTPMDFEKHPIWAGNDTKGYRPVLQTEPSPEEYGGTLFIKACFITNGYNFDGYLIGGEKFYSCGIFIEKELFKINLNFPSFTEDNLKAVYRLLNCKPFSFFPLHYESPVRLKGGKKIVGVFAPKSV